MSIGPYRIIEALGSGANGEVYLAEDVRLGRKVAVKTLSALDSKQLADAQRWVLREARAAARLNHPHIASVYDVIESPQGAHIVMEYVRGETLAARLRTGPLPAGEVLAIAIQLTDALAEAHGMGVVHRDLKPANVVLTPKGDVKILDFGLAQVRPVEPGSTPVRSSRDFSLDGRQIGTPPYMPPEHLMGDPVDARGDIYSLGVMLYELLTGRRPFRGPDAMALTLAILTEPTPKASGSNPAVPEALDAVVFRAMSRLPQDRYGSAAEMADDLRRVIAGLPQGGTPDLGAAIDAPTMSRPLGRQPRVRRPVALVGLSAIVALAVYEVGSRGSVLPLPTGAAGAVVAVLPLNGAAGDPQLEPLATGVAEVLIATLSKVPGITVVSRNDTLPYRDRRKGRDTIARELGATHIVDGSLQRSGDHVRITLSLLPAGSNLVAWSNTYDGDMAAIFDLQREVAQAFAQSVRISLGPEEHRRISEIPTSNSEALADYMQARTFLERLDVKGNLERAIELLQGAIRKDSRFAWAHAALAEGYWQRYRESRDLDWSVKARDEATEALRLDGHDAAVRYSVAALYKNTGRTDAAVTELRTAIALQPGHDRAHQMLGLILAESGHFAEGIAEIRRAIALRPNYWGHYHALGWVLLTSGRYSEAADAFRRLTELQPDSAWGFNLLGTAYDSMGDMKRAASNYRRSIEVSPNANAYSNLGTLYYREGRFAESVGAFSEALKVDSNSALRHRNLGDAYRKVGEEAKAIDSYRKAVDLSREALRANPRDAVTVAKLAVYEAKLGKSREAATDIARAIALAPTSADVLYREAVVLALSGKRDEGLRALEAALAHGYSVALAKDDDDLARLRSSSRYQKLISQQRTAEGGTH